MASECSSAMLDLNDADTEDTEAPSVTDDTREGIPLMMEHGYDIAVKVDAPMKQLSTLETFVTYRVRCVCARWPAPACVRRRYNHFKLLHKRLSASQPWLAPPPLPPLHTARQQLDRYSASFVAVRTMALNAFLDRIAKHPIFTHNEDFRIFLTTPDEELDKVFKSENSAMNLWGLSSALYGTNETKPTNGARVRDPEWSSHAEYLTSLQHKLSALSDLTSRLHRGSAQLAHEIINMKRCCDAWSSQARGSTARAASAVANAAAAAAPAACTARHRAVLPLLASYTAAHVDKIKQRDALHAAYVAGASTTGEMHNKLEQASEALRSELSDWLPKTRAEIKALLLELAHRQLNRHTQAYVAWEHALKLSTETNVAQIFKTVSKTAVQNLSPSKCRSETTETERDLDELENYSSDSDRNDDRLVDSKNSTENWVEVDAFGANVRGVETSVQDVVSGVQEGPTSEQDVVSGVQEGQTSEQDVVSGVQEGQTSEQGVENSVRGVETSVQEGQTSVRGVVSSVNGVASSERGVETTSVRNVDAMSIREQDMDVLSEILEPGKANDSMPSAQSSKSDFVSDPLRDFSEIDLRGESSDLDN